MVDRELVVQVFGESLNLKIHANTAFYIYNI
jgi:hypothetical protein